jgi:hypothetical protein
MYAQRLNPWDDIDEDAHDEELPDYEADTAPAYDFISFDEPIATFHLRQYDRKIQLLRPYGASEASSYRITTNSFRVFSKKPEMEVLYTSKEMRQRNIATMGFDKDGPIPWCPRAHFVHTDTDGTATAYKMEARNFVDWAIFFGDRRYEWSISIRPASLVLREVNSDFVIARFTYSQSGTQAMRGAEVGELTLFRNPLTMGIHGTDKVVCSMMVAITSLKKMGRNYSNSPDEVMRSGSMTREHIPTHRASSAGVSMI